MRRSSSTSRRDASCCCAVAAAVQLRRSSITSVAAAAHRINTLIPNSKSNIQACRPKKLSHYFATFFSVLHVFCAKKAVGACLYMPKDGHWLASFEFISPPSKTKQLLRARK